MALWSGSLISNILWLSQQGTRNIWLSLMLQGKQLHVLTYIPTFRLLLIDLRYCLATVLRPCYSPTSRRLIRGPNTLILGIIIYGIYCKKEKFRWIMCLRRKIRRMFSQKRLERTYIIIAFSEWVSGPFILDKFRFLNSTFRRKIIRISMHFLIQ